MSVLKIKNDSGEWQSITAIQGEKGETPVKGTDYWTAADKEEIVTETLNSIPLATTETAGKVKPDGTTITIDEDGTIHSAGGSSSASDVSFDNTDTGLEATNVQSALVEINTDLVGSEEVQEMINNSLDLDRFDGYSSTSTRIKKASTIDNISNIFTDMTFLRDNGAVIVEWDLDDITFTGSDLTWIGRIDTNGYYNTNNTSAYKVKLQKGRYYKMMNFYQVPVAVFYKLAPSMGVGLSYGTGTYPLDNGTMAVPIFKNSSVTQIYYPNSSSYVFCLAIWDITAFYNNPAIEEKITTLETRLDALIDGNEVSY